MKREEMKHRTRGRRPPKIIAFVLAMLMLVSTLTSAFATSPGEYVDTGPVPENLGIKETVTYAEDNLSAEIALDLSEVDKGQYEITGITGLEGQELPLDAPAVTVTANGEYDFEISYLEKAVSEESHSIVMKVPVDKIQEAEQNNIAEVIDYSGEEAEIIEEADVISMDGNSARDSRSVQIPQNDSAYNVFNITPYTGRSGMDFGNYTGGSSVTAPNGNVTIHQIGFRYSFGNRSSENPELGEKVYISKGMNNPTTQQVYAMAAEVVGRMKALSWPKTMTLYIKNPRYVGASYGSWVGAKDLQRLTWSGWHKFEITMQFNKNLTLPPVTPQGNPGNIAGAMRSAVYISTVVDDENTYTCDDMVVAGDAYATTFKETASYSITYNANGGTGAPGAQTFTQGQAVTLSSVLPTRGGYTFQGWSESASAQTADYSAGQYLGAINRNMNLYAVWKPDAAKVYQINASVSGGNGSVYPANQTVTAGNSATVTFTPNNGYQIHTVTDNGVDVTGQAANNRYTVNNVQTNHSIIVTYKTTAAPGEGSFKIKKVDSSSKTPLAGASFSVTSNSVNLPYGETVTTNNQGLAEVIKDFQPTATGELYLQEQTAPAGYEKPSGMWTVKVENGTAVSVSYSNPSDSVYAAVTKGSDGYWVFQNKKSVQQYTVTAQVAGGHGNAAPASQNVTAGNNASVTFTPDNGYQINTVTDNGNNVTGNVSGNRYTINNVQADHTIVVTYSKIPVKTYKVMAQVSGGHGTAQPPEQTVIEGESAAVTFAPDSGYQIEKITDNGTDVTGSAAGNRYTLNNVQADHTIVVTYSKIPVKTYKVMAQVSGGNGTAEPAEQTVIEGESAAITFTPDSGYQIEKITDNGIDVTGSAAGNRYTLNNVQTNHTVIVTYSKIAVDEKEFKLKKVDAQTGKPLPGAKFYITSSSVTLPYNTTVVTDTNGLAIVPFPSANAQGEMVIEEQTAPAGYEKPSGKWTVKVEGGTAASVTYSDSADNTYKVTKDDAGYWVFKNKATEKYSVTAEVIGGHGSAEPKQQSVNPGESAAINFVPENGYQIDKVTDNGTDVTSRVSENRYTISNVQENHAVVVTYSKIPAGGFSILAYPMGGGTVDPQEQIVNAGESATITLTPDDGFQVVQILDNDKDTTSSVSGNTYTIHNVQEDHVIFAFFRPAKKYTVTAEVSGGNGTAEPATQTVNAGESATVTFAPNEGYQIEMVTDNGTNVTSEITENRYTINNVQSNHAVVVTYSAKVQCPFTLDISNGELTDKNGTLIASPSKPEDGYIYNAETMGVDGRIFEQCKADSMHSHKLIVTGEDTARGVDIRHVGSEFDLTLQGVRAKYSYISVKGEIVFEGENRFGGSGLGMQALDFSANTYTLNAGAKVTAYIDKAQIAPIKMPAGSLRMLDLTMKETRAADLTLNIANDNRVLPANMVRIAVLDDLKGTWLAGDIEVKTEDGSKSYVRGEDGAPDGNYSDNNRYGKVFPLSGTDKDPAGIGRYNQVRLEDEKPIEICPLTFDESTGKLTDKNGDEITEGITVENGVVTLTDDIFKRCTIGLGQHTDEAHYLILKQYAPPKYSYTINISVPYMSEKQQTLTYRSRSRAGNGDVPVGEDGDTVTTKFLEFNSPNGIFFYNQREIYLSTKESGSTLRINDLKEIRYTDPQAMIGGQSSDPDTPAIYDPKNLLKCLDVTFKDMPQDKNEYLYVAAGEGTTDGVTKKVNCYAGWAKRVQLVDNPTARGNWLVGDVTITKRDANNINRAFIRGTAIDENDSNYTDANFSDKNKFGTTFPLAGVENNPSMPAGKYGRYKDVRFQNQVKLLDVAIPTNAIDFMVERQQTARNDKGLTSGAAEIENNSMYCWDYYTDSANHLVRALGVQPSEVGVDYLGVTLKETKNVGYKLKNYTNVSEDVMNTAVKGQPIVCLDAVADSKRVPLDEETPVGTGIPWFTIPAASTDKTENDGTWKPDLTKTDASITAPGVAQIKLEVPGGYTAAKPYCQASDKLDATDNTALTASHTLKYKLTFKEPENQWPIASTP